MFLSLHASIPKTKKNLDERNGWAGSTKRKKLALRAYAIRTLYQMGKKNTKNVALWLNFNW
jgi:hypothetical protein